jgi:hypothetical protein
MRAFLLLMLLALSLTPLLAAQTQWVGYQRAVAVVFVHPGQEQLAQQMLRMADEDVVRIAGDIGLDSFHMFPIFAYSNRADFYRDTGMNPSLQGDSAPPDGLIRIDVSGMDGPDPVVLAHEITHSLLQQRLGPYSGELPTWTNEGTAVFLSKPRTREEMLGLSRQQPAGGVLSLAAMEAAFTAKGPADDAYLQSSAMIAWLEYRHPGALRALLAGLAHGQTFTTALQHAAGLTPDAWRKQWQYGIPSYIIWVDTLNSTWDPFAPMVIVAVIVFAIRAAKRRKDRERAEEEEDELSSYPQHVRPVIVRAARRANPVLTLPEIPAELAQYPVLADIYTPTPGDTTGTQ